MDSKQFNRVNSNGVAAGREDSRWMRERIAELEARERELVEMARALKPNQASSISEVCLWRDEGWDALQKALAKIDKENSDDNPDQN